MCQKNQGVLYPSSETKVDRSSANRVRRCRQIGGATSLPAGLEARLVSWWGTLLIRSKLYSRSYFCKVFHFPFICCALIAKPNHRYAIVQHAQAGGGRGILATIHNLWRTEGVRRGFFKGMLYPIVSNGAINSIFFGVYGSLLPKLQVLQMKI